MAADNVLVKAGSQWKLFGTHHNAHFQDFPNLLRLDVPITMTVEVSPTACLWHIKCYTCIRNNQVVSCKNRSRARATQEFSLRKEDTEFAERSAWALASLLAASAFLAAAKD